MKVHLIMIVLGLSPLARGTRVFSRRWLPMRRFIPAGAGNTSGPSIQFDESSVYPRWRGEHCVFFPLELNILGLSPLARGTHVGIIGRDLCFRFIPAGAGNTPAHGDQNQSTPVYPRWRGEHPTTSTSRRSICGLSPLARGTLRACALSSYWTRFIPAGAGNTDAGQQERPREPVYPRWRGEHLITWSILFRRDGLSPLARGTHQPLRK